MAGALDNPAINGTFNPRVCNHGADETAKPFKKQAP